MDKVILAAQAVALDRFMGIDAGQTNMADYMRMPTDMLAVMATLDGYAFSDKEKAGIRNRAVQIAARYSPSTRRKAS